MSHLLRKMAHVFLIFSLSSLFTTSVLAADNDEDASGTQSTEATDTSSDASTPDASPASTTASAKAATDTNIEATLTDKVSGDEAVGEKSTFTKDTPVIYLAVNTDAVKKGQSIKAEWIADDTHNVAPANYKVDEKAITIDKDLASDQTWKGTFSLSKPTNGWPAGQYHVDLYVNKDLVKTVKFTIS